MGITVVTVVDRVGAAGGGERVAVDLATGLRPERFDSVLCVTRPCTPEALDAVRATGTRVIELNRSSRFSLLPWLRLVRRLRRSRVEVLHSHKFGSNAWSSLVARLAGVPVFVAHEHSWAFAGDRVRSAVTRHLVATRADALVTVSNVDRTLMIEREHVAAERVVVCPNGVPDAPSGIDDARLRRELGIAADAIVVGLVGGLRPEKRVDLLLRATATLRRRFPQLVAVVVGDGPDAPRLAELARSLGIEDAVRFAGRREDATAVVRLFDVAALTSDREGAPLALLEYMAAGKAIVATRVGGVPECASDGYEALLVPPDDADALAHAIARVLLDPGLAASLGRHAAARHAREFRLTTAVERIEALYEELLAA